MTGELQARELIKQCVIGNIWTSLQCCNPDGIVAHLDEKISNSKCYVTINKLKGLKAVAIVLLTDIHTGVKVHRKSFLEFGDAHALFLSYNPNETVDTLSKHDAKAWFRYSICHPDFGLPVYVRGYDCVILRSDGADLQHFLAYSNVSLDSSLDS